jgi:tRNA-dihydrouridine synthase B
MEQLLHYVWKHKLFPLSPLTTTWHQAVEVIDPGLHNRNAGPDFFNAKIKLNGTLWVGNVEIHDKASDWYVHGHDKDERYDNVILHVCGTIDVEVVFSLFSEKSSNFAAAKKKIYIIGIRRFHSKLMKIGNIEFGPQPLFLAPMEDVTDIGFRMLCKRFGAAMVYTEFVSAEALVRSIKSTVSKLTISDEERPVGIQIYGRTTEDMVEAAKIVEQAKLDVIDINFGCPVKKVAGKGAGAGMLRNIPLMLDITREVVKAVNVPVTVKTRLGWDCENLIITDLAEQLQDCGIQALTIHGRTRSQMYTGEADWSLIGEVKNNPRIHIPIIGNGDITTPEEAKLAFERYGVDAVMIGRATFGRPWIFKEIRDYLDNTGAAPLTVDEGCVIAVFEALRIAVVIHRNGFYSVAYVVLQFFLSAFSGFFAVLDSAHKFIRGIGEDVSEVVLMLQDERGGAYLSV